jgi:hypothetical protein
MGAAVFHAWSERLAPHVQVGVQLQRPTAPWGICDLLGAFQAGNPYADPHHNMQWHTEGNELSILCKHPPVAADACQLNHGCRFLVLLACRSFQWSCQVMPAGCVSHAQPTCASSAARLWTHSQAALRKSPVQLQQLLSSGRFTA